MRPKNKIFPLYNHEFRCLLIAERKKAISAALIATWWPLSQRPLWLSRPPFMKSAQLPPLPPFIWKSNAHIVPASTYLPPRPRHGLTSHQSQRGNNLIHAVLPASTGVIRCLIPSPLSIVNSRKLRIIEDCKPSRLTVSIRSGRAT